MTHRGPFQPLPFCDSVTRCWARSLEDVNEHNRFLLYEIKSVMFFVKAIKRDRASDSHTAPETVRNQNKTTQLWDERETDIRYLLDRLLLAFGNFKE